jgi:hypothetical protein
MKKTPILGLVLICSKVDISPTPIHTYKCDLSLLFFERIIIKILTNKDAC